VIDHRPAMADPQRFPEARVQVGRPTEGLPLLHNGVAEAAVIMSHHLETDLGWLRALAATHIPYVGLLGPGSRRRQLLEELGPDGASALGDRLHAPVGLDLGGRDPPSIALAIVAEIQAQLHGRGARSVDWSAAEER
jgi:xanthine/CO dehydrogenase XdhC/CoxF family maturation factor